MKYFSICFAIFLAIGCACLFAGGGDEKNDVIRVHVRANSNSAEDQNVKYAVKDALTDYLSPKLADVTNRDLAEKVVEGELENLCMLADKTLRAKGFSYSSRITFSEETFPTRVYDGVTFESGVYKALIIELGSGDGDNWWCVMYPPLCFINAEGEGEIEYRSWIKEFFEKRGYYDKT